MSALGFDNSTDKGFSVKKQADVCTELNRICKDSLAIGVGVKVLTVSRSFGSFLPIIVGLDGVLGILGNYLCQTLCGEICHLLGGSTRLLVDEVSAVSGICAVLFVHRNTRIPSCAVPSAAYNQAVLTEGCKFKRLFVRSEREDIAVLVCYLVVFLLKRRGQYVLLGGYKLGAPYIACGVGYDNQILCGVNCSDNSTVADRFAVYGYAHNRSVVVGIAVRPRDFHVALGVAVGNVIKGYGFLCAVDNNGVFARGVVRRVASVEHIFSCLGKFSSRNILNKFRSAGELDKAIFTAHELDIFRIGVRATSNGLSISIKLCCRDLTVNFYGVGCRGITCAIGAIEGIRTFRRQLRSACVGNIARRAGFLHIDSAYADVIRGYKSDIACIGRRTRLNGACACIKRSRGSSFIKPNRDGRRLIIALIYTVELIFSFGCKLSSRSVGGEIGGTGHLHIAVSNTRTRVTCYITHISRIGVAAA